MMLVNYYDTEELVRHELKDEIISPPLKTVKLKYKNKKFKCGCEQEHSLDDPHIQLFANVSKAPLIPVIAPIIPVAAKVLPVVLKVLPAPVILPTVSRLIPIRFIVRCPNNYFTLIRISGFFAQTVKSIWSTSRKVLNDALVSIGKKNLHDLGF